MRIQNKLYRRLKLKDLSGAIVAENSDHVCLEKLRRYGMLDDKRRITSNFLDMLSALTTLPLYNDLIQTLNMPLEIVIIRDILELLINQRAEHAIYIFFNVIYGFSKNPMPKILGTVYKDGRMIEFASFFVADLTEIIYEEFSEDL